MSLKTEETPAPPADVEEPYSIFTPTEKWVIVSLIAFGGLFSPLSANIYFPAIPALAAAFHKPIELINLTAFHRWFWGTISDTYGRRHAFILCLLLLSLSCVGLALTPTSTVAISVGVVGDISTRADRGSYLGLSSIGPMVGPAIGPVLGGVLADKLGWRAIFWFLCIASAVCMIVMILFLPETLRAIVGNGSISLPSIYYPVVTIIGRDAKRRATTTPAPAAKRKFQNPLLLLLHVDIVLLLLINGIVYSVFYGVTASISTVFHDAYPQLNETELGLCFLTVGGGMLAGSARLRLLPAFLALFVVSCIGYGWCIDKRTSIGGPLIFLVGVGLVVIIIMNSMQTLMLDLMPTQGSAITACNNLVRCGLGAGLVSGIQPLLDALGPGYAYLLLGGLSALMGPLLYLVMQKEGARATGS
ncbi:MFS general substrate transporter [Mycena olivaceomarginata]|nr:MFS general substrate transporter [Mycena olivaceomarginata]